MCRDGNGDVGRGVEDDEAADRVRGGGRIRHAYTLICIYLSTGELFSNWKFTLISHRSTIGWMTEHRSRFSLSLWNEDWINCFKWLISNIALSLTTSEFQLCFLHCSKSKLVALSVACGSFYNSLNSIWLKTATYSYCTIRNNK